jgi:hypothetical protein
MDQDRPRPSLGRPQGWDPVWERPVPPSLGERLAPVLVFAVALVAYLRTLLPGLAFDTWGEMQTVPHVLGIARPTGYPTYVLAARLFELLPLGSVAYRSNLLSGVLVALALATVTWTATRLGVRPAIAAGAALATGAVGTLWATATVAGVDPLHLLLMALLLDRSLAWADHGRSVDLALCGLLTGLALGNDLLAITVAPVLALFALWSGRQSFVEQPVLLFLPILTLLLGLSVYLYLPAASRLGAPAPYTLDEFLRLAQAGPLQPAIARLLEPGGLGTTADSLPALGRLLIDRGALLLPVAGLAGVLVLVLRRPALGLALAAVLLLGAAAWAGGGQREADLLVPLAALGLGTAVVLEALARGGADRLPSVAARAAGPAAVAAGIALAVVLTSFNLTAADRSADHAGDDYVAAMTAKLPQGAALVTSWGTATPLWHAQLVLAERPDLLIVDAAALAAGADDPGAQMARMSCQRPVFVLSTPGPAPTGPTFTLQPAFGVQAGVGSPTGTTAVTVYRLVAAADTCQ